MRVRYDAQEHLDWIGHVAAFVNSCRLPVVFQFESLQRVVFERSLFKQVAGIVQRRCWD
jgi:hypothetical protein